MKILLTAVFAAHMAPAIAGACSEVTVIRDTMYAESRGAPLEHAVAVGHSIRNRAKRTGASLCRVAKQGWKQKRPPVGMTGAFDHLARGVISGAIPDNTMGADSYNDGHKPNHPGRITRHIAKTTFYIMKEKPTVR